MVDSAIPRHDFLRESAQTTSGSRHFTFHMGQNDIQPKAMANFSFANYNAEM